MKMVGLIAITDRNGLWVRRADARNEAAIKKIYEAKGRPSDNPSDRTYSRYGTNENNFTTALSPENVKTLMQRFWPGPISFILTVERKGYLCDRVSVEV
jgi:L-threonylcarbamoyladenylate synthase